MNRSTDHRDMTRILGKTVLTLYHTICTFTNPDKETAFENIVGEGENAGNQHFLLVPQCFLPDQGETSSFWSPLICRL